MSSEQAPSLETPTHRLPLATGRQFASTGEAVTAAGPLFHAVVRALGEQMVLNAHLQGNIVEKEARIAQLHEISQTDSLTGLSNRAAFSEAYTAMQHTELGRRTSDTYRPPVRNCLLMVDLDYFKPINDIYGHVEGDRVLFEVAGRLQHSIRNDDSAFRWGGEEFAVLLRDIEPQDAALVAERVRFNIAVPPIIAKSPVTASIGMAWLDLEAPLSENVERADKALYFAKENGRDRIGFYRNGDPVAVDISEPSTYY